MAYRKITDIKDTIGMRAVFYARVSTAEEEQLNAIELQIEENRGCIKDHGWKLVGEYIDRSKSGTMVKGRDDYQRLYEDLYEDLFDIVVIKDQERLQRNTLDWYLFINRVVQTGKLLFMYMDGKFYSPDDALITGVRAIIAEEFSRNLSKKLHNYHDHRIEKARQGQEIALQGSGNVYGWDKKDGKYYINPEQAKVRRLMCEGIMARKGSTLIAKELNDAGYRNTVGKSWKPMDIPKFVYDCKNVGTMIINKERHDFESKQTIKLPKEEWVYVENALPPIVTQEEWDLICKIHEERVIATGSDRRGKKTSGYSFSGKLVCGICGAPYWRKQRVSKDEYWVCSTKQTKGRRTRKRDSTMGKAGEINPLGCDNENISYNSLMEIMGVVSERLQANTDTIKQDMINWLTKLRKQLLEANGGHTEADLQRELSRKSKLLDAYLDGILNKQEYQKKAEELDERIIQLKTETEKNKANSGDIAEIDKVLANIDEEVARYVDGNEKLKIEYLLEHLEQVQIFPDKVIVIVPILSEGIVVEKTQYVSREKGSEKAEIKYNGRAAKVYEVLKTMAVAVVGQKIDLYDDLYYRKNNIWGWYHAIRSDKNINVKTVFHYMLTPVNIYRFLWDMTGISLSGVYGYSLNEHNFKVFCDLEEIEKCISAHEPETEDEAFVQEIYDAYKNGTNESERTIYKEENVRLSL